MIELVTESFEREVRGQRSPKICGAAVVSSPERSSRDNPVDWIDITPLASLCVFREQTLISPHLDKPRLSNFFCSSRR
jgi:hypothetical protein